MKAADVIVQIFFSCLLLVEAGCESVVPTPTGTSPNLLSIYASYTAAELDIMPLTEFVSAGGAEGPSRLKVYVSLLDSFGCQQKTPGVFRFELYDYVQRSAEPKGKRIIIWPDINLTKAAKNNKHWRDFLRAYEFNLDFEPERNRSYVLQATCLCPNGRRLSADFTVKCTK